MDEMEGVAGAGRYNEPRPRWGHVCVSLQGKVYMWGGRTEDFSEPQQRKLASSVEVFDCKTETWATMSTRGTPPRGLYNAAYTLQGQTLYVYGGWDGQKAHNSLYRLDLTNYQWAEVKAENKGRAPTEISGCGLVACGNRKLVLFGGYGVIEEKKEEKKTKAKVDERYALVTAEVEVNEETVEQTPVENGAGEQKATDKETQEKAVDKETKAAENGAEEKLRDEAEQKVEDSATKQNIIENGEERKERKDENQTEEKGRESGENQAIKDNKTERGGVVKNGLVESVMAEIKEREEEGERKRTESIGEREENEGGEGEAEKNEDCDGAKSEGEEKKEGEKDDGSKGGDKDGETESVSAEEEAKVAKDSNVKEVDVVNEHVSDKSQKAVVIKLPRVSFKLPPDAEEQEETAQESETTDRVTGVGEVDSSVGDTPDTAATEPQPQGEQTPSMEQTTGQSANTEEAGGEEEEKKEEEEEKEDIEEYNTTFSIYKRNQDDAKGWTNEVKVFDLDTRMWSSQPTSGSLPPPSVDFSFTSPDKRRGVVFGGYQPPTGITYDTFLLDMDTWVWRKLSGESDAVMSSPTQRNPSLLSHPSARDGHSACVIEGAPRPLILVTGGWDATDQATNDMWLLDINSGLWKQIMGGKEMGCRFWHTTVVSQSSTRMRQLLTFGGCPGAPESHTAGSWPKMADTVLTEMGKIPSLQGQFSGGESEERWIVVDTVTRRDLGDPLRRLRETVLLTSFRAQRAESLMKTMIKKMSSAGPVPQRKARGSVRVPTPDEVVEKKEEERKEEEEEKVKRPFWQKGTDEIQMTYEEIGRGRYSVVKVAIFHETKVAARCLFTGIKTEKGRQVFTECLELAAQLRHPNLVSFMGAILDREPIIVTELMGCNLRSLLEKSALTYYQLVDVAEGVSKGLQYLHSVKPRPVIHGELTSTGVLLEGDRGPRLKAKLSDYVTAKYFHHLVTSMTPAPCVEDVSAHAREHPSQEYKSRLVRRSSSSRSRSGSPLDAVDRSTRPFRKTSTTTAGNPLDPGHFTTKGDVYMFGILQVEMATRAAVLEVSLQYLIESIAWAQVTALVKKCLNGNVDARPDMTEVVSHVMQLASSKP